MGGIPDEGELGASDFTLDDASVIGDPSADAGAGGGGPLEPAQPGQDAAPQPTPTGDAGAPVPSETCAGPSVWYADDDGDGFGTAALFETGCVKPEGAWSPRDGDCADDDPRVHPQQTTFFGEPYARADGSESYDYDCSGVEEGHPGQPLAPERCDLVGFPMCNGGGYASTSRKGAGLNGACGSTMQRTCKASAAVVLCQAVNKTVDEPYLCR